MTDKLAILDLVNDDLKRVEGKIRDMGAGAYGPLAEAFLHLIESGGKRLRPALALAAYRISPNRRLRKPSRWLRLSKHCTTPRWCMTT